MGGILSVVIKYNVELSTEILESNLKRLINQIYKLLPLREEGNDWQKPLETIIEELGGMANLLIDQTAAIFPILCKLEGLFNYTKNTDFGLYRRTIFECLSLLNSVKENVSK